jgi:DNA-binding HxlR family transcriptional regulator
MIVFRQTRFSQFMDTIDGINSKTLTARLRELERSGLISRKAYPEVPPRVEYCLTQNGRSLMPVLKGLASFSIQIIVIEYFTAVLSMIALVMIMM